MRRVLGGGVNNNLIHFDEKVWSDFIFFISGNLFLMKFTWGFLYPFWVEKVKFLWQ